MQTQRLNIYYKSYITQYIEIKWKSIVSVYETRFKDPTYQILAPKRD